MIAKHNMARSISLGRWGGQRAEAPTNRQSQHSFILHDYYPVADIFKVAKLSGSYVNHIIALPATLPPASQGFNTSNLNAYIYNY